MPEVHFKSAVMTVAIVMVVLAVTAPMAARAFAAVYFHKELSLPIVIRILLMSTNSHP